MTTRAELAGWNLRVAATLGIMLDLNEEVKITSQSFSQELTEIIERTKEDNKLQFILTGIAVTAVFIFGYHHYWKRR